MAFGEGDTRGKQGTKGKGAPQARKQDKHRRRLVVLVSKVRRNGRGFASRITHTHKTRLGGNTSPKPLWCLCARTRTEAGLALHTDCAAREILRGGEELLPPGLPALECCASVCVVFCAPFARGLALPSETPLYLPLFGTAMSPWGSYERSAVGDICKCNVGSKTGEAGIPATAAAKSAVSSLVCSRGRAPMILSLVRKSEDKARNVALLGPIGTILWYSST